MARVNRLCVIVGVVANLAMIVQHVAIVCIGILDGWVYCVTYMGRWMDEWMDRSQSVALFRVFIRDTFTTTLPPPVHDLLSLLVDS